jgi:hypothetical protein
MRGGLGAASWKALFRPTSSQGVDQRSDSEKGQHDAQRAEDGFQAHDGAPVADTIGKRHHSGRKGQADYDGDGYDE